MYIESTEKLSIFKGDPDGHKLLELIESTKWIEVVDSDKLT